VFFSAASLEEPSRLARRFVLRDLARQEEFQNRVISLQSLP
jgi:hypothetical protein